MKKIVVTGANGFIAKNVIDFLSTFNGYSIIKITRDDDILSIRSKISNADILFHFAGVNRPKNEKDFEIDNFEYTKLIFDEIVNCKRDYLFVMSSSTQALLNNQYGGSKKKSEDYVINKTLLTKIFTNIYRFPGVFGKGCKPNYNSVVATYCYNISHHIPIKINNPDIGLNLIHVDDVSNEILKLLNSQYKNGEVNLIEFPNAEKISLKNLADLIKDFYLCHLNNIKPSINNSFELNLHNTFLTYL
jgi:UDP-2-acetamido-2,6-beta-L-arabino-hexul-4-ose reductase